MMRWAGRAALVVTAAGALSACALLPPPLLPVRPVDGAPFASAFSAADPSVGKVSGTTCGGADLVGSAFVAGDGLVLTAAHVVADARTVELSFPGSVSATAQVVASDPDDDTALLRVSATLPPALRFAGDPVPVGDPVGVIGIPVAEQSASTVVARISARDEAAELEGHGLRDLLVVDAEVQAGSSGGPVLDAAGAVQGMVSARLGGRGGRDSSASITLAIPAERLVARLAAWADQPAPAPCT